MIHPASTAVRPCWQSFFLVQTDGQTTCLKYLSIPAVTVGRLCGSTIINLVIDLLVDTRRKNVEVSRLLLETFRSFQSNF